jgi:hypothetical protein
MKQLKNFQGLPMYFLVNKTDNFNRVINFADTELSSVGDILAIGYDEFKITEIIETRLSNLDYGINKDVYFQSVKCDVIKIGK